jgi:hypothetical protein
LIRNVRARPRFARLAWLSAVMSLP